MKELSAYMHLWSTSMLITNLVCVIFLIPISIEVLTLMHFLQFLLLFLGPFHLPLSSLHSLWHFSGVEAGKKAAGEVLALQKRVLAVLNEARHVAIILIPVYLFVYKLQGIHIHALIIII